MDGKQIRNKLIGSDDQRAVSPVIGVILMVAITVILAAVIAAFVLDMGDPGNQTLTAQADITGDGSTTVGVEITGGGDDIDGIAFVDSSGTIEHVDDSLDKTGASNDYKAGSGEPLSKGTEYTVYVYEGDLSSGGSIDDAEASLEVGDVETGS
ncbi:type IV pilin [Natrinema saccharevitans]|uniref:type IV pilin n=1 Tax=Natrinema saccharevitans TaxID=301967 RepID=UPI00096C5FCA|nr:type IV pilin N-terminal domain-containing protein [Natrinema saccharevitans]